MYSKEFEEFLHLVFEEKAAQEISSEYGSVARNHLATIDKEISANERFRITKEMLLNAYMSGYTDGVSKVESEDELPGRIEISG